MSTGKACRHAFPLWEALGTITFVSMSTSPFNEHSLYPDLSPITSTKPIPAYLTLTLTCALPKSSSLNLQSPVSLGSCPSHVRSSGEYGDTRDVV